MPTLDVELLPHQHDFVSDMVTPWLLDDGGRGTGKTKALCTKAVVRASVPNAREGLFRQNHKDLKATTLKTLLEGDGDEPPVLPQGYYDHNKSDHTIKIHGGGEIIYSGMDHGPVSREMGSTGKGSSLNLSGAGFDEVYEISEANVLQISGGIRVQVPGLTLQRYMVCNPGNPSHWLCERFGMGDFLKPQPRHRRIFASPADNWHLPDDTLEELRSLKGVARARYLEGKWIGSEGMVYNEWIRASHVVARGSWQSPHKVWVGVDEGFNDPFAVIRIEEDADGNFTVTGEHYQTEMQRPQKIEAVKRLAEGATAVVVDNGYPEFIEALNMAGVHAEGCVKGPGSVIEGIERVKSVLSPVLVGAPGLRVCEACTNTIKEFETYEWKPGADRMKDEPMDRDNHAMDSIRYALKRALARASFGFYDTSTGTWVS